MSNEKSSGNLSAYLPFIVIPVLFGISVWFYMFILGDEANFDGGDPEKGHPIKEGIGGWYGTVYKGGPIVPILICIFLTVIAFSVERFITIFKAKGKGAIERFIRNVRGLVSNGQFDAAIAECDRQRGSVANVLRAGIAKYQMVDKDSSMPKEAKLAAIQKELEEVVLPDVRLNATQGWPLQTS